MVEGGDGAGDGNDGDGAGAGMGLDGEWQVKSGQVSCAGLKPQSTAQQDVGCPCHREMGGFDGLLHPVKE